MREEIDLQPTEPITHTSHSHWREWLLCEDYSLNKDELKQFYEYYQQCNVLFDQNPRWDLIKELYQLYFDEQPKVEGKQWMRLGFQGKHPQTDFRGGGIFSLKLILRFVQTNKPLVQKMQVDKGNFFFAITSINIFFFMKNYFHLSNELIPDRDQHRYCNRRALKNFCKIIVTERGVLEQMHELFLTHFYKQIWVKESQQNELLQFNQLFDRFKMEIREIFENHNIEDFHEFIRLWNNR